MLQQRRRWVYGCPGQSSELQENKTTHTPKKSSLCRSSSATHSIICYKWAGACRTLGTSDQYATTADRNLGSGDRCCSPVAHMDTDWLPPISTPGNAAPRSRPRAGSGPCWTPTQWYSPALGHFGADGFARPTDRAGNGGNPACRVPCTGDRRTGRCLARQQRLRGRHDVGIGRSVCTAAAAHPQPLWTVGSVGYWRRGCTAFLDNNTRSAVDRSVSHGVVTTTGCTTRSSGTPTQSSPPQ